MLYGGTATFKGDDACNADHPIDWPKVVHFRLCFKSPDELRQLPESGQRSRPRPWMAKSTSAGSLFQSNSGVVAQVTIHTDHPFWDSTVHDSPAHFDQFAARVVGQDGGEPTVVLEDTRGVDYTAYTDAFGRPLHGATASTRPPMRTPRLSATWLRSGERSACRGNNAATGLRDYYDFATYNQSTQGHLNSDGLCFVKRNYLSPR